ncbi:hypothetical protein [Melioribacter sp. OK-6-Me]|uniref:hypothetical protein n=1 Tax=unclassified Melioribacter TaxID=2627329 RepID=UPI003ED92D06
MKIKNIIFSWDLIVALALSVLLFALIPSTISNEFAVKLYDIGISVLSIVFSVFFAAMAIIISASDDDFVRFLDEEGDYTAIIGTFKFSLMILFVALIYSIILSASTSYMLSLGDKDQCKIFIVLFTLLFSYGLFATLNSTYDAIKYAQYRTKFLKIKKKGG